MIRRNKQTLKAPKRAREGVLIGKDQLFEAGLERVRPGAVISCRISQA